MIPLLILVMHLTENETSTFQQGGISGPSLANLLTDLISGGGHTTTYDSTIIEAVKRYRDRAGGDASADRSLLEELKTIRGTGASEGDAELQKELMLKWVSSA